MNDSPVISLKAKLAVAVLAVTVAAGLCELMARAVYPAPQDSSREPRILYQSRPDMGGFLHVPNQRGWIDDGFVTINSLGLRGQEPEVPKPAGSVRVLAIGDSTTFGLGVGDAETYVAQLDERLKRVIPHARPSTINGAISGYNLTLETSLLRHFAPILQPDVVLVGVFWNDLPYESVSPDGVPQQVASTSPTAAGGADAGSAASASVPATFRIGNRPSGLNRALRSSRLIYVARQKWLGFVAPTSAAANEVQWEMALLEGRETPSIGEAWSQLAARISGIRDLGATHGFDVGVVVMPIRAQVEQDFPQAAYQTRLRAIAEAQGLFVIDPLPRFREQSDRAALFIPYDRMHYSARGNAILADVALEALRERPAFTGLDRH